MDYIDFDDDPNAITVVTTQGRPQEEIRPSGRAEAVERDGSEYKRTKL